MGFGGAAQPATGLALRYLPAQHFFMTIATTLGTGILALPVKLSTAGIGPLALTLTVVLVGQIAAVLLMVELLQRAQRDVYSIQGEEQPVSLHLLSRLYLRRGDGALFTWAVLLHLVSILVSYLLAGSVSVGSLLGLDPSYHAWLLAPYALNLTLFLLKFYHGLTKVVSLLTAAKLCLILVMMGVTASLIGQTGSGAGTGTGAGEAALTPVSDWHITSVLHPFLIATVALGGVVNVMPIMAGQIPRPAAWGGAHVQPQPASAAQGVTSGSNGGQDTIQPVSQAMAAYKQAMGNLATSVCSGLVVCWALNLLWAWLVLSLVPQTIEGAVAAGLPKAISLEAASKAGQISTVPLVALIRLRHPSLAWIATSVSVFMAVSISVSYIVMGSGLRNLVDGLAGHWSGNTDSRDGIDRNEDRRGGLRDPSPLLLRPVNTHTVATALASARPTLQGLPHTQSGYNAQWALSVKDGGGGTGLEVRHADGRQTAPVGDSLNLPGAGSVGADVQVAAANILSRMAEEEAQLSLMLSQDEDDEESDGADGGNGSRSHVAANRGAAGAGLSQQDMVEIDLDAVGGPAAHDRSPADASHHAADRQSTNRRASGADLRGEGTGVVHPSPFAQSVQKWLEQATHAANTVGRTSRIILLPVIVGWRWVRSFLAHRAPWLWREPGLRYALYVSGYGVCYLLAQAQPHGFLTALEVFTSLALNLSCGYYIATMFCNARRVERGLVPLPPLLEYGGQQGMGARTSAIASNAHGHGKTGQDAWEYWNETEQSVAQEREGLLQEALNPPAVDQPIPPAAPQVLLTHASEGLISRTPKGSSSPALADATEQSVTHSSPVALGADATDMGPVRVDHGAVPAAASAPIGMAAAAAPWTLSPLASTYLPLLAWGVFACAIIYDVVETLARAMPWTPAIITTTLLCVAGQHTGLSRAMAWGMGRTGRTDEKGSKKSASLGGLTAVLLWAAACGLAGAAGVPSVPSLLLSFLPVGLSLLAKAAAKAGARAGAVGAASVGAGAALTCALYMSIPSSSVAGMDAQARQGLACTLAWAAVGAHLLLMLKAVLQVAIQA